MRTLTVIVMLIVVSSAVIMQQAPASAGNQRPTSNVEAVTPLKLSAEDQKQLDLISDRAAQMKPQIEAAQKQQAEARAKLAEANSFLDQYNAVEATRMAFFFRVAADVCHCDNSELEFSSDGKGIVRKKDKSKP